MIHTDCRYKLPYDPSFHFILHVLFYLALRYTVVPLNPTGAMYPFV